MSRLPTPGHDDGAWGNLLNDFLLVAHAADGSIKPGAVTKAAVGLGNADNTSDADKPVSAAVQAALDAKVSTGSLTGSVVNAAVPFQAANAWRNSLVVVQGVAGDYTGRYGVPGTGTDARASIQAALDEATEQDGNYWYAYLKRRAVTVRLPAGIYVLSARSDGQPSLTVPEGVHLDLSEAMLFFDYPATATGAWSAILLKNTASITLPSFMAPSARVSAPGAPGTSNTNLLYDGIRLLGNDNATSHVGARGAAEIKGFQGASIRGIGTWITRIDGAIKLNSSIGYVASNWPANNVYGYAHPSDMDGILSGGIRVHTDVYFTGVYFNENKYGGFIGAVSGDPANPHTLDFTHSGGLQAYFDQVVFEQFAARALYLTGSVVSLRDCAFEEVGDGGNGMAWLQSVQSVLISNHRVNYSGRSVPGPSGNTVPFNDAVWKITSVSNITHEGGYVHNTFNASMKLFSAAAAVYHVLPPRVDAHEFPAGAMYVPLGIATNATILGGGRVSFTPGRYFSLQEGTQGTTGMPLGTVLAFPFIPGRTCTIDYLGLNVTIAGTASSIRAQVCADNNGVPDLSTVAGSEVAMSTVSTGVKDAAPSWSVVEGRRYWLVMVQQGAASATVTSSENNRLDIGFLTKPGASLYSGFPNVLVGGTANTAAAITGVSQTSWDNTAPNKAVKVFARASA
ncbi:MAG TPA: hypothetical protein VD735_03685 [Candidatus Saccharimonadales bacterium]|nr:hypothetical protein [Candidatus Saccharimonadales bacterium]